MVNVSFIAYENTFKAKVGCLLLFFELISGGRCSISNSNVAAFKTLSTRHVDTTDCQLRPSFIRNTGVWMNLRGGMTSSIEEEDQEREVESKNVESQTDKKKMKKKKSKPRSASVKRRTANKKEIQKAMAKTTDVADILGQEIRNRRDILLSDPVNLYYDASMSSLGYALGMSVPAYYNELPRQRNEEEDGKIMVDDDSYQDRRRVKLENYFFKSHCGLYWIQTLSSLLASVLGTWSVSIVLRQAMVPQSSSSAISNGALPFVLMRRCLLTALSKYVTGFGAIILLSAAQIRSIGLHRTRTRIRKILTSTEEGAIAQYLFYCAILLVWTRPPKDYNILPWYMSHVPLVTSLLGPILLREIVHVAWVISDIMVIISRGQKHGAGFLIHLLHSSFAAVFNGWMRLLVGSDIWSKADSLTRQRLLSVLAMRLSLLMELCTGCLILLDTLRKFADYCLIIPGSQRPPLMDVVKGVFCSRLYLHYLQLKLQRQVTQ